MRLPVSSSLLLSLSLSASALSLARTPGLPSPAAGLTGSGRSMIGISKNVSTDGVNGAHF